MGAVLGTVGIDCTGEVCEVVSVWETWVVVDEGIGMVVVVVVDEVVKGMVLV